MLAVKAENMAFFISKEREDIVALWDELYLGEAEREAFLAFHTGTSLRNYPEFPNLTTNYIESASEETLLLHELEKKRLFEQRAHRAPILKLLHRYFDLLQEMADLEVQYCFLVLFSRLLILLVHQASSNDPSRLTKGVRGDPGRLLREEKTRKRVQREKPKVRNHKFSLFPDTDANCRMCSSRRIYKR
jgi:protein regulator of cytokinesis 1